MKIWERVAFNNTCTTDRLRVPGGWLYRETLHVAHPTSPTAIALVFVSTRDLLNDPENVKASL